MNNIKVGVERSGFPVSVGGVELFFDSSIEHLRKFISLEDDIKTKVDEINALIDKVPDDYSVESYDQATTVLRMQVQTSWDVTFGDGTFNQLYEKYPDLWALLEAYDLTVLAIVDEISHMVETHQLRLDTVQQAMLKKRKKKTGK